MAQCAGCIVPGKEEGMTKGDIKEEILALFSGSLKIAKDGDFLEIIKSIIENDLVGFAVICPDGRYMAFNRGAEKLTGYDRSEFLGVESPPSFYSEKDGEIIRRAFEQKKVIENMEIQIKSGDGRDRELVFSMSPRFDSEGEVSCYLQILIDNREKKHLQRLILHSNKMETIGEMAGGIAHDFNNLLEGVLGYTSFMMDLIDSEHELFLYLEMIENSARKASKLTERLLSLSSGRKSVEEIINCNVLIRNVIKLFEKAVDKKIVLETNLDRNLKAIKGSPAQIEQALLNICLNAKDAMPDGGKLVVTSSNIVIDEGYPKLSLDMTCGEYIRIAVSDTGIGMDENTSEKIFEPFFTTKSRGEGTGLGLNIVYGIVHSQGGFINVYSEPGKGTTFTIYLRAAGEPLPEIISEKEKGDYKRGEGQLILFIDDEQMILDIGGEMLGKLGYKLLTANSAKEGMRHFTEKNDEISLIILDVIMPGENGTEILHKIRELKKEVPVILSSGYDKAILEKNILDDENVYFMQKPYSMADLGRLMHKVISKAQA
ncbi:MAG: response regulator [Candidatus Krumholzibacteriota bacterium]|nr:response regulator [Candidatus Krumholzibacteriota bacterium]